MFGYFKEDFISGKSSFDFGRVEAARSGAIFQVIEMETTISGAVSQVFTIMLTISKISVTSVHKRRLKIFF